MREILFKAKRIGDDRWIEGYYVDQYNTPQIYIPNGATGEYCFDCYHIDPNTLCQYTGLTDKNGNKIWENDIVYIPYIRLEDSYCKVIFRRGQFIGEMADGCEDSILNSKAEVIGNIFDNADLVKE